MEADVHPPKSSSAVTDGCLAGLFASEIGLPHPPVMSFGVIREGTFPRSTLGAAGLAGAGVGSGAPHGLLSAADEPHGSNIALLFELTGAGRGGGCTVLVGCADRLNAEPKSLGFGAVGDATLGGGAAEAVEGAEDHPPKSSLLKRSVGIDDAGLETGAGAGLGAGGVAGVACCVKEKSRAFFAAGLGAGLGAGGLVGVASKKPPPLRGGGEVTCAAAGVDLVGIGGEKLDMPEKADGGD